MFPHLMFDASTPPETAPNGYQAVAGYIGGYTPHVWTAAEWARFKGLKKLPIYVPGVAVRAPYGAEQDGSRILGALARLRVPKGSPVAVDTETATAPGYLAKLRGIVNHGGYAVWVYGSADTVFGNPACDGYWVADYAGRGAFMYPHSSVRATQYANGTAYDSSEVKQWSYWFRLKRDWI